MILSVITWHSKPEVDILPDSATSHHPDLSLQTISRTASSTSTKLPSPSGDIPTSSNISLRSVNIESLFSPTSVNHSGWLSADFLSTLLTPPPGNDQRSGKAGSSEFLWPISTSYPWSATLLSIADAERTWERASNGGSVTPSGNSSMRPRGDTMLQPRYDND